MLNYKQFRLSEEEVLDMVKNAIITFDTSVLLDLYYYSENTRKEIFNSLISNMLDRLWIPSQVYFEYQKNREKVIFKPKASYLNLLSVDKANRDSGYIEKIDSIIKDIDSNSLKKIRNQASTFELMTKKTDKHPYLEKSNFEKLDIIINDFEKSLKTLKKSYSDFKENISIEIEKNMTKIDSRLENDDIYDKIGKYFRVGKYYPYSEILEIVEEGRFRYENSIPPGYMDKKEKKGFQIYGDLIVWKQILDIVKEKQKPVILVSNDEKEDWVDDFNEMIGPRYELIKECYDITGQQFWILNFQKFVFYLNSMLEEKINEDIIDEIDEVQQELNVNLEISLMNETIQNFVYDNYFESKDFKRVNVTSGMKNLEHFNFEYNSQKIWMILAKPKKNNYMTLLNYINNALERDDKGIRAIKYRVLMVIADNEESALAFIKHSGRSQCGSKLNIHANYLNLLLGYICPHSQDLVIVYDNWKF